MTEKRHDRLSWLDWIFVCLLVFSLIGFVGYWYKTSINAPGNDDSREGWTNVLAIDMYRGKINNQQSILQGNDLIFIIPPHLNSSINFANVASAAAVENFQQWGLLTTIIDPTEITPQDPRFNALGLLVFNPQNSQKMIVPLYQAGVRAFAIYRAPFLLHIHINSTNSQQVIGYAIMSDGSQRLLHLVPFATHYLQGPAVPASN